MQSLQKIALNKKLIEQPNAKKLESTVDQEVIEDKNSYYQQTVIRSKYNQIINWVFVDGPEFNKYFMNSNANNNNQLNKNYLKASVVKLKFFFPYYGHLLNKLVVATGGFIYVGSLVNPLITKTQYIAPLMANFDPALSDQASVKYVDTSTHFICTWQNLVLQDQPESNFQY